MFLEGEEQGHGRCRQDDGARGAANRVVFMSDGAVVEAAEPKEFFENPKSDRAKDFLGKILKH